jgi:hypothetical protein
LGVIVDAGLLNLDPAQVVLVHGRARSAALSHVGNDGTVGVRPDARAPLEDDVAAGRCSGRNGTWGRVLVTDNVGRGVLVRGDEAQV